MWQVITKWLRCYLSDPEAVSLLIALLLAIAAFMVLGNVLVPIIASIIIAYMLSGFVARLEKWKCPHVIAVILVYLLFISVLLIFFIWLLPILFEQLSNLFKEVPDMLNRGQAFLINLQQYHPEYFSAEQIRRFISEFSQYFTRFGRYIVSFSLASIANIITIVVYVVLVPLLVFFFLKDNRQISKWMVGFLPKKHHTIAKIWREVDKKIGDYIRGKIIEIIIVAGVSVITFAFMGINYAVLLAAGIGLSVIIPYVGAILVTIPVVIIAFLQWGWNIHFAYLLITYTIIITLDANLLVPVLFSEKMRLHPVAIILAVLAFGALWGFWGVFFAIPLATLVDVLIREWPRKIKEC
jgi:putative permease